MTTFNKMKWVDHIVDMDGQNVLQVGSDLSADNFNRLEEGVQSLIDFTSGIEYDEKELDMVRQNQMIYLIEEDIRNKSTEMDVGYWFDSLKDRSKIHITPNMQLKNNTLKLSKQTGNVQFKVHDIGFVTDRVTMYVTTSFSKSSSIIKIPFTKESDEVIKIKNHDIKIRI